MDLTRYLLVKLAEEASEVSKEALKEVAFGVGDQYMGRPAIYALRDELVDFVAVAMMVGEQTDVGAILGYNQLVHIRPVNPAWVDQIQAKRCKVCHYALYSVREGLLTLTPEEHQWVSALAKQYQPSH